MHTVTMATIMQVVTGMVAIAVNQAAKQPNSSTVSYVNASIAHTSRLLILAVNQN